MSHCTPLGRHLDVSPAPGWHTRRPLGRRLEQQRHGRRAGVLVAHAALAEVAGPALARQHRRRRVPPRRGGVPGVLQRRWPGARRRRGPRPARRRRAPARRTSSCRRARPCRGRRRPRARPAARRRGRSPRRSRRRPSELPIRRKSVPNSGPLAPPTVETSVIPTLENSAPGVGRRALVERGHGGLHAPVHVRPVVGVADRRVELGQVVAVLRDQVGEAAHPLARGPPWSRSRLIVRCPISVPKC